MQIHEFLLLCNFDVVVVVLLLVLIIILLISFREVKKHIKLEGER